MLFGQLDVASAARFPLASAGISSWVEGVPTHVSFGEKDPQARRRLAWLGTWDLFKMLFGQLGCPKVSKQERRPQASSVARDVKTNEAVGW